MVGLTLGQKDDLVPGESNEVFARKEPSAISLFAKLIASRATHQRVVDIEESRRLLLRGFRHVSSLGRELE